MLYNKETLTNWNPRKMKNIFACLLVLPLCLNFTEAQAAPLGEAYVAPQKNELEVSLYVKTIDTKSGQKALIYAEPEGGQPPYSYTWVVNDKPYDPAPNVSILVLPIKNEGFFIKTTVRDSHGKEGKGIAVIDVGI